MKKAIRRRLDRTGAMAASRLLSLFARRALPASPVLILAGCAGEMSWLEGASDEGAAINTLIWPLFIGAGVIWAAVMGLAYYATRTEPGPHGERDSKRMIVWCGMVLPTVVVSALLFAGLGVLREIGPREGDMVVEVDGEQWWWRTRYLREDGEPVVAANEIRMAVGRSTTFMLTSDDVIHSFWIPALGGKTDMIPGRTNRLTLTPTRAGVWRGACAEYCGGAHAQMAFPVVVMEPDAFDAWLADEARDAVTDEGSDAFLSAGCGACHTVRGTEARGEVGPDLTHIGSRLSVGAGILPMSVENLAEWTARTHAVKPGVKMPSYGMLADAEIDSIAHYLASLK